MEQFDVVVIGQGYAGLRAAKLAAARGLRTANPERAFMGGLVLNINELEPRPVDAVHSGAELCSDLAMENADNGVVAVSEEVTAVSSAADGSWVVQAGDTALRAKHVIVASGARLRKLGVPGETEFFGRGVSECADCDGPMFMEMDTVVVGGGDSAFQEALALSQFASKVTIVMRGAAPRASADLTESVLANPKVTLLPHSVVTAILGAEGGGVEGVRVRTGERAETTLPCSGVFVFVGLEPNTAFLPGDLRRDAQGALVTSASCATDRAGLWAIGAVRSGYGGKLSDAAADAEKVVGALS